MGRAALLAVCLAASFVAPGHGILDLPGKCSQIPDEVLDGYEEVGGVSLLGGEGVFIVRVKEVTCVSPVSPLLKPWMTKDDDVTVEVSCGGFGVQKISMHKNLGSFKKGDRKGLEGEDCSSEYAASLEGLEVPCLRGSDLQVSVRRASTAGIGRLLDPSAATQLLWRDTLRFAYPGQVMTFQLGMDVAGSSADGAKLKAEASADEFWHARDVLCLDDSPPGWKLNNRTLKLLPSTVDMLRDSERLAERLARASSWGQCGGPDYVSGTPCGDALEALDHMWFAACQPPVQDPGTYTITVQVDIDQNFNLSLATPPCAPGLEGTCQVCAHHRRDQCIVCRPGHTLLPDRTCEPNACSCANGMAAQGRDCTSSWEECAACDPGFVLELDDSLSRFRCTPEVQDIAARGPGGAEEAGESSDGQGVPAQAVRIVGGQEVASAPCAATWMAALGFGNGSTAPFCGGAWILPDTLLTAAHCVPTIISSENSGVAVEAGRKRSDGSVEYVGIVRLYLSHEQYDEESLANDIALVRVVLTKPGESSDTICLASQGTSAPNSYVAFGWGLEHTGLQPDKLQWLRKDHRDMAECNREHPGDADEDAQLCAGGKVGEDTCHGDSGGPLATCVVHDRATVNALSPDACKGTLFGLTSWGSAKCGVGKPAVYVNVAHYADWIGKTVADFPGQPIETASARSGRWFRNRWQSRQSSAANNTTTTSAAMLGNTAATAATTTSAATRGWFDKWRRNARLRKNTTTSDEASTATTPTSREGAASSAGVGIASSAVGTAVASLATVGTTTAPLARNGAAALASVGIASSEVGTAVASLATVGTTTDPVSRNGAESLAAVGIASSAAGIAVASSATVGTTTAPVSRDVTASLAKVGTESSAVGTAATLGTTTAPVARNGFGAVGIASSAAGTAVASLATVGTTKDGTESLAAVGIASSAAGSEVASLATVGTTTAPISRDGTVSAAEVGIASTAAGTAVASLATVGTTTAPVSRDDTASSAEVGIASSAAGTAVASLATVGTTTAPDSRNVTASSAPVGIASSEVGIEGASAATVGTNMTPLLRNTTSTSAADGNTPADTENTTRCEVESYSMDRVLQGKEDGCRATLLRRGGGRSHGKRTRKIRVDTLDGSPRDRLANFLKGDKYNLTALLTEVELDEVSDQHMQGGGGETGSTMLASLPFAFAAGALTTATMLAGMRLYVRHRGNAEIQGSPDDTRAMLGDWGLHARLPAGVSDLEVNSAVE